MSNCFIVPLGGTSEYVINGVRYNVSSRFLSPLESKVTVFDKFKNAVGSEFIDLTNDTIKNTLDDNVCSTAGKED